MSEHGRHLQQYFNLFVMYANLGKTTCVCVQEKRFWFVSCWNKTWLLFLPLSPGLAEKTQLLKLSVPATFMLVALDEGPGPPIKYQYAELTKLYAVVSQLLRCCDVSTRMQSSINGMFHSVTALWLLSLLLSFLSLSFSLSLCFIRSLMVPFSLSGSLSVILSLAPVSLLLFAFLE